MAFKDCFVSKLGFAAFACAVTVSGALALPAQAANGDGIKDTGARAVATASQDAGGLGDGLRQIGTGLGQIGTGLGSGLGGSIGKISGGLTGSLGEIGGTLGGSLGKIGGTLGGSLGQIGGSIGDIGTHLGGNFLEPTPGTTSSIEFIDHDGLQRRYIVIKPDPVTVNAPMMILLHAHGLTPERMANLTTAGRVAVSSGAWVFVPEAVDDHTWHEDPSKSGADDVGFLSALIDRGVGTYKLDAKHVYVAGYSSGGFMAQYAGCQLSTKIAAIGAVAASLRDTVATSCLTTRHLPVALVEGTSDLIVPYRGELNALHGALYTAAYWADRAGCVASQTETTQLPDTDPHDGTTVSLLRYTGCPTGTGVRLYTIDKGGHTWPGSIYSGYTVELGRTSFDIDATLTLWQFLIGYSLP